MLQLCKNNVIVNNEFTYPNFMTQHDRDFQKVLQALTAFDKKLSALEDVVKNMAEATTNYASSQQNLNKEQSELNKVLGEALKFLGENLNQLVKYIRIKEGN